MRIILLALAILIIATKGYSQQPVKTFSGSYTQTPFVDFVTDVESKTDYRFFFKNDIVDSIYVNISGSNMKLDSVLFKTLIKNRLYYYIANNSVIIYDGYKIVEQIDGNNISVAKKETKIESENQTTQDRYEQSKVKAENELIVVGSKLESVIGMPYIVSGRVIDEETGEPVIGATLYVEELKIGAATDYDGYFNLTLKTGKYSVELKSMSMGSKNFFLQVYSSGKIDLQMKKELIAINEVQIFADRHDNVRGMQMGFERMSSKTIKEIPVVMGEKDLLKVAQMLPGVQSAGEGSSGIIVRGGTADQNLFYINKIPIYNTSHLFGFFTAFSSDIVNDFSLYKSNIPAEYGGRISSIFDISTRQGNKKNFYAKGGISPVTAHVSAEGPIVKDKCTYVASYRGTYSDWLLSKVSNEDLKRSTAAFYDVSASVNTMINDKNSLKVFGYNSNDNFSLAAKNDYRYSNMGGSASLKHFFSPKLNGDFAIVHSEYNFSQNDKNNVSEAYSHNYVLSHSEAKADMNYMLPSNHKLSFGGSSILYNLNRGDILPYNEESTRIPVALGKEKGIETAVYASDEFSVIGALSMMGGLRISHYIFFSQKPVNQYFSNSEYSEENVNGSLGKISKSYFSIEPRVALNYMLFENTSLKASYNRMAQNIFVLSNTIAMSPTDQWKLADYYIKPPVSNQLSFGVYQNYKGLEASAEVYGKKTKNIVEYKDGIDFISENPVEMLLLQGEQKAYGLEFIIKRKTGKLTGWLSYTYSRSSVLVDSEIEGNSINFGKPYSSNYDIPHSLNLVSNLRVNRRVSFSTNVVYSTGRPATYPTSAYYFEGMQFIAYSERNEYRLPDYFRVDFSINMEGNLNRKKFIHSSWMLNVYNVTGRKNAYSVYFESEDGNIQGKKLSVFGTPIVTLSWNFKLGNYVSD